MDTPPDYDVAIVGYGPVGQLLAALLGQRGHSVVALERYAKVYPMPRAVHFDDEVARILQGVDIRSDTNPIIEPYDNYYVWRNADRKTLLQVDWSGTGPSWWHTSNFFSQPELERELDARARRHASVDVRRGVTATGLDPDDTGVTVMVRPTDAEPDTRDEPVRARYLVGCDGANSTVRTQLGLPLTDLGFFFDWLILDMIPKEPMTFDPPAWQLCDPKRPTTIVPGGPGRRRWEFMALPGEDINDLNRTETAWGFLQPWGLTPDNSVLERHTVYRFQAHWADQWRAGRAFIAGDAAHLMPPFAGQGMCAGLRDVVNLAWKLDLVLTGIAGDRLLDTYGPERTPHVRYFIDFSIDLGRVICVPGEDEAAERDRQMMAVIDDPSLAPAPPAPPRLGPGLFAADDPTAGRLSIQSRVSFGGASGLFDDVIGRGWFVLTTGSLPAELLAGLTDEGREVLVRLGARVLRVVSVGDAGNIDVGDIDVGDIDVGDIDVLDIDVLDIDVLDLDGRYADWFAELSAQTVIVRPDFYVYAATDAVHLGDVLAGLAAQLAPEPAIAP